MFFEKSMGGIEKISFSGFNEELIIQTKGRII
jgi:hypothetical protein